MKGSIARGTVYLTAQQGVAVGSMAALHIVSARLLGPAAYGSLLVVLSALSLLVWVALAGIPEATSKFIAEEATRARGLRTKALWIQGGVATVLALALFATARPLARALGSPELGPLFRIGSLALPLLGLAHVNIQVLNGMRAFGRQAVALGGLNLFRMAGIVAAVALGFGIRGALVGVALGAAATLGLSVWLCRAALPGGTSSLDTRLLTRFAVQVSFTYLAMGIWDQVDMLMLKSLMDAGEVVGFFAGAAALVGALDALLVPLLIALFPAISEASAAGDREGTAVYVRKGLGYAFVILWPLALGAFAFGPPLVSLVYGSPYSMAASILGPLAVAALFYTLYMVLDTYLRGSGNAGASLRIAGGLLAAHVALNLILIPKFGLAGVVVTVLVTSVGGATLAGLHTGWRLGLRLDFRFIARVALAGAIPFAPLLLWRPPASPASLALALPALAVYAVLVSRWQLVDFDDLRPLGQLARALAAVPAGAVADNRR